ncbi:hypothetical protein BC937DRAFT_93598 [Endogone sp. FLAS-F59071]|nr:hypothetical protein BC937DRAFT_93598 [Endogone sp. FLAS-F59071]|eukprot:RUS23012.1 hypothetical protein BC937DRAFT_93598 [Endogone sp. FLAS-F59071]
MKFAIITLTLAMVGGVLAAGDPTLLPNTTYELLQGWEKGRKFWFYTFNVTQLPDSVTTPPAVAPTVPIYKFVREASDDYHNTTQASVIDFIPGDVGYSDLWQVVKVVVPANLPVVTSYDSLAMLVANKTVTLVETQTYVNCPVVGANSTLGNPDDAVFTGGYYKGFNASWFDFGPNPNGNMTAPLYHVLTPTVVPITDSVPGDSDYTAFWNIFIYNASTSTTNFTSVSQIPNPTYAKVIANCPIVKIDAAVATTTPTPTPTSSSAAALLPSGLLTITVMMILGMTLNF